jgi:LDH2 family malate/lactate/ureidoglycolate dehydrogenase
MTTDNTILISHDDLRAWVARCFERADLPPADAAVAADALVAANLRGIDSHGVLQMPLKVRRVRLGAMKARPNIRAERGGPAAVLVDGDNGVGMVVGAWAMRLALERARETGIVFAAVRQSNHFGMAAYYVQMAAAAGMIGLCGTNGGACMAPWGSVTPYLSTNPLAFATPGGIEGGLTLDMATSQVAWGKVELALRAGRKIPLTWATDQNGRPTDDPQQALSGLMLPLGGYKGYGLALMIDILCGILSGSAFGSHVGDFYAHPDQPEHSGHFFVAINIEHFISRADYLARLEQMVAELRACQPGEGVERIYVPGEIEAETAARRRREGIPLPPDMVRDLTALGEEIGEPFRLATA